LSPDELADWRQIERAVKETIPRRILNGFDYNLAPAAPLEVPIAERIEGHRTAMKASRQKAADKRVMQLEKLGYKFTEEEKSRFPTVKGLEKLNAMIADAKSGKASAPNRPSQQQQQRPRFDQTPLTSSASQQSPQQFTGGRGGNGRGRGSGESRGRGNGEGRGRGSGESRGRGNGESRGRGGPQPGGTLSSRGGAQTRGVSGPQ